MLAAENDAIDAVVEDTAELEVSTVDPVAVAPQSDTEEISEEGGTEVQTTSVGDSFDSIQSIDVPSNRATATDVQMPTVQEHYTAEKLEGEALETLQTAIGTAGSSHGYDASNCYFTVIPDAGYEISANDGVTAKDSTPDDPQTVTVEEVDKIENTYYISSTALESAAEGDITVSVAVEAIKSTVTVTGYNEAGIITDAKYSISGGQTVGETTCAGSIPNVTVEDTLTLKFTLSDENYSVTVKRDDVDITTENKGSGTSYIYELTNITKATTIAISTDKTILENYKVTTTVTPEDTAVIEFEGSYDSENKTIVEGKDLVFTVKVKDGYKLVTDNPVTYSVGGASKGALEEQDGKYTIEAEDITGAVAITVNTVAKSYSLSFDITKAAKATVTSGEEDCTSGGLADIEYGDEVEFTVTADEGQKIRYVGTDEECEAPDQALSGEKQDDGSIKYTFEIDAEIEEATTIYIKTTNLTDPLDVTFTDLSDKNIDVYEVTPLGEETPAYSTTGAISSNQITSKEDETVYFAVVPQAESKYEVDEVTANGGELDDSLTSVVTGIGDGEEAVIIYALDLTDVQANVAVAITTKLDRTQANIVTFKAADGTEENSFEIIADDLEDSEILTVEGSITFQVETTADYYRLENVTAVYTKANEEEETRQPLTADSDDYTITFSEMAREVTVLVETSTRGLDKSQEITFHTVGSHMTLTVPEQDDVTLKSGTSSVYELAQGLKYLDFSVKASGKYTPEITAEGSEDYEVLDLNDYAKVDTKDSQVINYHVPAILLSGAEVITIGENTEPKTLTVIYNENGAEVVAKVNGRLRENDGTDIYYVDEDSEVILTATALANSEFISYTVTEGEEGTPKTSTLKKTGGDIKLTVKENTTVTIASKVNYALELKDGSDAVVAPKSNTYTVDFGTYNARMLYGAYPEKLSKVEITAADESVVATTYELKESGRYAAITVSAKDAGKTLNLTFYRAKTDGDDEEAPDHIAIGETYKLTLPAAASEVKVSGTGYNDGKLTTDVDSLNKLTVKASKPNAKASLSDIGVEITKTAGAPDVEADLVNGTLEVTVAPAKADIAESDKAAVIKLYKKSMATTSDDGTLVVAEGGYITGGEITVSTTAPAALKAATPTVSQASAGPASFDLNLGMPRDVKIPNEGNVYYKVEVAAKGEIESLPEGIKNALGATGEKTFYVKSNGTASQTATIRVSKASDSATEEESDIKGVAWDFSVTVSLLQTTADTEVTTANEEELTAFTGKDSATLEASTKDPYYETKLSLKKGDSTVYTGQSTKIATINYGKDTTIKYANAYDLTWIDINDDYLKETINLSMDVDPDGAVWMTVEIPEPDEDEFGSNESTRYDSRIIGSHDIQVVAATDTNTYAASATIKVNVVRGIQDLEVTAPNYLYRADGTKVTLKPTVTYNLGKSGTYVPKKKAVTYALAPVEGAPEDFNMPGVSINAKNGTVTVDKSYTVKADRDANKFRIVAMAADFVGNEVNGYSEPIEISSEAMQLGDVCIVEPVYEVDEDSSYDDEVVEVLKGYRVVARPKTTDKNFTSDQLDGKKVVVLKKNAIEKSFYSVAEIDGDDERSEEEPFAFSANNVTFKSSNKALSVAQDGTISVSKAANGIKITAAANDGSKKNEATLEGINIITRKIPLGLFVQRTYPDRAEDDNEEEIGWRSVEDADDPITFTDTTDTALRLKVVEITEDGHGWKEIKEISDFKASVKKGGKALKTVSTYGTGQYITFVATAEYVNIELSYKDDANKAVKTTFTIHNEGFVTADSPTVKQTSSNLIGGTYLGEQWLTYTVENNKKSNYEFNKESFVKLEVDKAESYNAKKQANYDAFKNALDGPGEFDYPRAVYPVNNGEKGTFELCFNNNSGREDYYDEDLGEYVTLPKCTYIPAGSYKLHATFGKQDVNGGFVPTTKTITITVKVTAQGKPSYKPVSKVKMSLGGTYSVALRGTGKNIRAEKYVNNLQDANVNGRANGFTKYFELYDDSDQYEDEDGETVYDKVSLRLKVSPSNPNGDPLYDEQGIIGVAIDRGSKEANDYVAYRDALQSKGSSTDEEKTQLAALRQAAIDAELAFLASKDAKDIRTGYVTYKVYALDGSLFKKDTVKITVEFAEEQKLVKYSAVAATILENQTEATINIKAGNNPASIDYAYVVKGDPAKDGGFYVEDDKIGIYDSRVPLKTDKAAQTGNYNKIDLRVIPSSSYYSSTVAKLLIAYNTAKREDAGTDANGKVKAAKDALEKAFIDYGVPVTATVKVVAPDKSGNKIALVGTKYTFTSAQKEYADGTTAGYDPEDSNYWIDIPYTTLIPSDVTDVKVTSKNSVSANSTNPGIEVFGASIHDSLRQEYEDGREEEDIIQDYLRVTIKKDILAQAFDEKLLKPGKETTVKLELSFGTINKVLNEDYETVLDPKTENIKKQSITLKLTMPNPQTKSWKDLDTILTEDEKARIAATSGPKEGWNSYWLNDDDFRDGTMIWYYDEELYGLQYNTTDGYKTDGEGYYYDSRYSDEEDNKDLERFWTLMETSFNVRGAIVSLLPEDTNIRVITPNLTENKAEGFTTLTVKYDEEKSKSQYKAANSIEAGYYDVEIILENVDAKYPEIEDEDFEEEDGKSILDQKLENGDAKLITFHVVFPASGEEPKDVKRELDTYVLAHNGRVANSNEEFGEEEDEPYEYFGDEDVDGTPDEEGDVYAYAQSLMAKFKSEFRDDNWLEDWDDVDQSQLENYIMQDARVAAKLVDENGKATNSLRLRIEHFEKQAPGSGSGGYLRGKIIVWGPRYGGRDLEVPFKFLIPRLEGLEETATKVDEAVKALLENPTNLIGEEEILGTAGSVISNPYINVDFATIEESDLVSDDQQNDDAKWELGKAFKNVKATRDDKGFIRFILLLTNTRPAEGEEATKKSETYYAEIAKQLGIDDASDAVKGILGIDDDDETNVPDEIITLIIRNDNDVDDVREAILQAAGNAVEKDGYSVDYKTTEAGGAGAEATEAFEFTPAKYKGSGDDGVPQESDKGSISFTLVITDDQAADDDSSEESVPGDGAGSAGTDSTKEIVFTTKEIEPNGRFETLEEAQAEIEEVLDEQTFTITTDEVEVETALEDVITSDIIACELDFAKEDSATVLGAGTITLTFDLTKHDPEDGDVTLGELNFEYPVNFSQTLNEAVTAATSALDSYVAGHVGANKELVEVTVAESNTKLTISNAVKGEIVAAVNKVIDTTQFEASIDDTKVTATKATSSSEGSVSLSVTISRLPEDSEEQEEVAGELQKQDTALKSWTIAQLKQNKTEAETAAKAAIEEYKSTFEEGVNATDNAKTAEDFSATDLIAAINDALEGEAVWTASSGTGEGEPSVEISEDDKTCTYSGKIIITCDENIYDLMEGDENYPESFEIDLSYLNANGD